MAKNTYYFPHDYNARGDEDLVKLRAKLGWEGFGLYWAIIEKLHENKNSLSRDYGILAFDLQANVEIIENIVEKFDLFILNDKNFGNSRVKRNLKNQEDKIRNAQKGAKVRWNKDHAGALPEQSTTNAIKEKKGEEIKEIKEIKEINNIYKDFAFFEDEIFKKSYSDYLDMRKKKKRVATETAEKLVLKELHKYSLSEAITMLENSIKSSWTDVYPLKDNKKPLIVIQE